MVMKSRRARRPSPPEEILNSLYLAPHRISVSDFAAACGVSRKQMSMVLNGRAGITVEMAVRIAAAIGTTALFWLSLQNARDVFDAEQRLAKMNDRPRRMAAFGQSGANP